MRRQLAWSQTYDVERLKRQHGCLKDIRVKLIKTKIPLTMTQSSSNEHEFTACTRPKKVNFVSNQMAIRPAKLAPNRKYSRRNCLKCAGCLAGDCLKCVPCRFNAGFGNVHRRTCSQRKCLKPLLSPLAKCNICFMVVCGKSTPLPRVTTKKLLLMECGICGQVVHPFCQIKAYNLDANVQCKFYKIPNAWDCLTCCDGGLTKSETPVSLTDHNDNKICSNFNVRSRESTKKPNLIKQPKSFSRPWESAHPLQTASKKCVPPSKTTSISSTLKRWTKNLSKESDKIFKRLDLKNVADPPKESPPIEPTCVFCLLSSNRELLMICHACGRVEHEYCSYSLVTKPPYGGLRNCLHPNFWECSSCLFGRGVSDVDSVQDDEDPFDLVIRKTEKAMFSSQVGVVTLECIEISIPTLSRPVCVDESRPRDLTLDSDVGRNGCIEDVVAASSVKPVVIYASHSPRPCKSGPSLNEWLACGMCDAAFSTKDRYDAHVQSQHPRCRHCKKLQFFKDLPSILAHFKSVHGDLKQCLVRLGGQTLRYVIDLGVLEID